MWALVTDPEPDPAVGACFPRRWQPGPARPEPMRGALADEEPEADDGAVPDGVETVGAEIVGVVAGGS